MRKHRLLSITLVFLMLFGTVYGSVDAAVAASAKNARAVSKAPLNGCYLGQAFNVLAGLPTYDTDTLGDSGIWKNGTLPTAYENEMTKTTMSTGIITNMSSYLSTLAESTSYSVGADISAGIGPWKASVEFSHKYKGMMSQEQSSDKSRVYAYLDLYAKKYYYTWNTLRDEYATTNFENLNEDFINELLTSRPQDLFDNYGTHLFKSYNAGSMISAWSTKEVSQFGSTISTGSESETTASASLGYGSILNASANGMYESTDASGNKITINMSDANSNANTYGGELQVFDAGQLNVADLNNWLPTVNTANARVLMDDQLQLYPIWNLLAGQPQYASRMYELKSYFNEKAAEQGIAFYKDFVYSPVTQTTDYTDYITISTPKQLAAITDDLSGKYVLTNDIDLTDIEWTPIGTADAPFMGILDGNGCEIQDLTIEATGGTSAGLFGYIGTSGVVKCLGLTDCSFTAVGSDVPTYAGAIAAVNLGKVELCYNTSEVKSEIINNIPINNTKGNAKAAGNLTLPTEYAAIYDYARNPDQNRTIYVTTGQSILVAGAPDKTYSDFKIMVTYSKDTPTPALIVFSGFNGQSIKDQSMIFSNNAKNEISIYSTGEVTVGETTYGAAGGNKLYANGFASCIDALASSALNIYGDAPLKIYGGANNDTIKSASTVNIYSAAELRIIGGNGTIGNVGAKSIVANTLNMYNSANVFIAGGEGGNGSDGVDASSNGIDGSSGGVAIDIANKIVMDATAGIYLYGGYGGHGGDGSSGANGYSYVEEDRNSNGQGCSGGNGGKGGAGGAGGAGADVATANTKEWHVLGTTYLELNAGIGGDGGNGSKGGNGGRGQDGRNAAYWLFGDKYNGSKGGKGGDGGDGGAGGNAGKGDSQVVFESSTTLTRKIDNTAVIRTTANVSGNGGDAGAGGNGGAGGAGGNCNEPVPLTHQWGGDGGNGGAAGAGGNGGEAYFNGTPGAGNSAGDIGSGGWGSGSGGHATDHAQSGSPGAPASNGGTGSAKVPDDTLISTLIIGMEDGMIHSYLLYYGAFSWTAAKRKSAEKGGNLVTICSEVEQKAVEDLCRPYSTAYYMNKYATNLARAYIGATDEAQEGNWTWYSSGASLDDTYTNWNVGEPNNSYHGEGENYSEIGVSSLGTIPFGAWNDIYDKDTISYICEKIIGDMVENATYASAGGLVGCNYGTISLCYNNGDVVARACSDDTSKTADAFAGGIAGKNLAGHIENSYNTAAIHGEVESVSPMRSSNVYAGGIAALNAMAGSIGCVYNVGTVTTEQETLDDISKEFAHAIATCTDVATIECAYNKTAESPALKLPEGVLPEGFAEELWHLPNEELTGGYKYPTIIRGNSEATAGKPCRLGLSMVKKTVYFLGELLTSDEITVVYRAHDGVERVITPSSYYINYNLREVGMSKVRVVRDGMSFSYPIEIRPAKVCALEIAGVYNDTFEIGDAYVASGVSVRATYTNGEKAIVVNQVSYTDTETGIVTVSDGFTVKSVPDMSHAGAVRVTLCYGGLETSYMIVINPKPVAEGDPHVHAPAVVARTNEVISVPISIKNNPGIISLKLNVSWDASIMTLQGVRNGEVLCGDGVMFNYTPLESVANAIAISWVDGVATQNTTADGTLAVLEFKIKELATQDNEGVHVGDLSQITVATSEEDTYNHEMESVSIGCVFGKVTIVERLTGDVTADGKLNTADAIILLRYLVGWENVVIDEESADVNKDTEVNTIDAVLILRHIVGWDIPYFD